MSEFRVVGSAKEIPSSDLVECKHLGDFVDYEGHRYEIVGKKEHIFSLPVRFGRVLLGIVAVAFTFFRSCLTIN